VRRTDYAASTYADDRNRFASSELVAASDSEVPERSQYRSWSDLLEHLVVASLARTVQQPVVLEGLRIEVALGKLTTQPASGGDVGIIGAGSAPMSL